MRAQPDENPVSDPDEAWWRAQALALALEISVLRGRYEAELGQMRQDSSDAIAWLQEKLSERDSQSRGFIGALRGRLRNMLGG